MAEVKPLDRVLELLTGIMNRDTSDVSTQQEESTIRETRISVSELSRTVAQDITSEVSQRLPLAAIAGQPTVVPNSVSARSNASTERTASDSAISAVSKVLSQTVSAATGPGGSSIRDTVGLSTPGGGVGAAISKVLINPVVGTLLSLFGGGKEAAPPPLPRFQFPESINLTAGIVGSGQDSREVDRDYRGLPRVIQQTSFAQQPPVTIQVQTFDSRSFVDHSEEIARAVRQAILESHSVADVISEL